MSIRNCCGFLSNTAANMFQSVKESVIYLIDDDSSLAIACKTSFGVATFAACSMLPLSIAIPAAATIGGGYKIFKSRHTFTYNSIMANVFNSSDAKVRLADMYAMGFGLPSTESAYKPARLAKAITLYKEAADQGHSGAQFVLAARYRYGTGLPQNAALAKHYCTLAASNGNSNALYEIALDHKTGTGGFPQDPIFSVEFLRRAAISDEFIRGAYDSRADLAELNLL